MSANGNSHINGKKLVNGNSHPDQFEMYYTGANALTLNGNVNMSAVLYSPYAQVNVLGTFDYFGVLHALALDVGGTATLNEQEGVFSSTPPNDLTFKLKKTSQRYR